MANPGRMAFDLALMNLAYLSRLACAGIWLALASCASVSVRETIPLTEAPTQGPQTILVQPFEFEDDMIRVNRQGAELETFKRDLQKEMTANLYERIRRYIAPSQVLYTDATPTQGNSWLISGRFTRVNQGSRLFAHHSRLWIGRRQRWT